jgi:hypothetical protein
MWISRKEYADFLRAVETLGLVQGEYATVREIFIRLVEEKRTISFNWKPEVPDGTIKWDTMETEAGSKEMTVWFEKESENARE